MANIFLMISDTKVFLASITYVIPFNTAFLIWDSNDPTNLNYVTLYYNGSASDLTEKSEAIYDSVNDHIHVFMTLSSTLKIVILSLDSSLAKVGNILISNITSGDLTGITQNDDIVYVSLIFNSKSGILYYNVTSQYYEIYLGYNSSTSIYYYAVSYDSLSGRLIIAGSSITNFAEILVSVPYSKPWDYQSLNYYIAYGITFDADTNFAYGSIRQSTVSDEIAFVSSDFVTFTDVIRTQLTSVDYFLE